MAGIPLPAAPVIYMTMSATEGRDNASDSYRPEHQQLGKGIRKSRAEIPNKENKHQHEKDCFSGPDI